ncbi:MAG: hypothetical protein ACODAB_03965 [Gemmatimonadota bacterium]
MIGWLRRLARESIRGGERLLHTGRRRRALRELAAPPAPRSVLIVCLGNICRSPYAEHRLIDQLARAGLESVRVASAGFILPGRPSPEPARRVAARRGVDLGGHRSQVVTSAMARDAEVTLVMAPAQLRQLRQVTGAEPGGPAIVLGDLDPHPIDRRTIVDPYGRPDDVFEAVYERIDRCCETLVDALACAE